MSLSDNTFSVESIIEEHLYIVNSCARKLYHSIPPGYVEEEDLISEGLCALVKAAKEYEPSKHSTFAAYIKLKATGAMKDYLRKLDILSQQKRKQVKDFQKNLSQLESKLGRAASEQEILFELNITKKQYIDIIHNINISSTLYLDSYEYDFLDSFHDLHNSNSDSNDELLNALTDALEQLSEREKLIFQLYFYEELSFKEISIVLDISNARVSQIYSKALSKLRNYITDIINKKDQ